MASPSFRPYVWMLLGSFAFALMGIFTHEAGQAFPWQAVAIARCAIPLTLVGALALAGGVRFVFLRPRVLWMRSIAGSFSLVGTFYALTRLPVADVFTVTNIFPVWVALLSWFMLKQAPSLPVWLSVLCGIAGVAIIQQPHLARGDFAILVALAVSVFTAFAMIGLHRLQGIDTRAVVVHFSMVSLAFAVAAYFLIEHDPYVTPTAGHWWYLAGVGIAATFGQVFLTKAFTHGEPSKVSVVGLTQIVFALLLDAVLLGHPPAAYKLLGVPLVIAPTAWLLLHKRTVPDRPESEPLDTPAPE